MSIISKFRHAKAKYAVLAAITGAATFFASSASAAIIIIYNCEFYGPIGWVCDVVIIN